MQWTGRSLAQTPTVRLGGQTYTAANAKIVNQTYSRADMLGPRANGSGYFFPGSVSALASLVPMRLLCHAALKSHMASSNRARTGELSGGFKFYSSTCCVLAGYFFAVTIPNLAPSTTFTYQCAPPHRLGQIKDDDCTGRSRK